MTHFLLSTEKLLRIYIQGAPLQKTSNPECAEDITEILRQKYLHSWSSAIQLEDLDVYKKCPDISQKLNKHLELSYDCRKNREYK